MSSPVENIHPLSGGVIQNLTDMLRRDISLGVFAPGTKLKISHVQKEYAVSAASAREALSQLSGEGYVQAVEQRGFFVTEMSEERLLDNARVRAELEALGLIWSIARQTSEWRASVVSAHYLLQEAESALQTSFRDNIIAWDERNREFHLALVSNAGSPVLLEMIGARYDLTRRFRLQAYAVDLAENTALARLQQSADEHAAIAEATLSLDAEQGAALLKAHISKNLLKSG
ncbi:GntR family transcriptional regulator [Sulfitobacter guttiformis]|uniref:GntR family transcriptional regulator n=1 Tax=Sulfitobacter guttiformis TaxID=74349 RepID=A0A420DTL4_9RHOB|nr:FCD domain-containing protein [Sulfitobacter guttiformis]KIN71036.1 Transcriptional regulator, GntR family,FCD domain-containing protein [Sulfitobacter guttiformis KCTC 32187]RKE97520.1 GntR family transcriptional regulator [Sulfitobacter guttiformis]